MYPNPGEPQVDLKSLPAGDIVAILRGQIRELAQEGPIESVGAGFPGVIRGGVILESPNLGQLKLQLRYYQCSKKYEEDVRTELAKARAWVEQRAGQVVNPAIVLDIDETSLSNWDQMVRNDFGFIENGACDLDPRSACGQRDWILSANGVAIAPTLELFKSAKARNVAVFFITGRYDDAVQRAATEFNLRKVGYLGWDGLFLRDPKTSGRPVSEYKTGARMEIEKRGYTIIANVGDQESDLANGHAEKPFKVPNPFYFIP